MTRNVLQDHFIGDGISDWYLEINSTQAPSQPNQFGVHH
jgi:hypothetical protein